jgi:hypothetical protein
MDEDSCLKASDYSGAFYITSGGMENTYSKRDATTVKA